MSVTRIIAKVSIDSFNRWLEDCEVNVSPHAMFRLSDQQRTIFDEDVLVRVLNRDTPVLIGLQNNGRYAAFFRRKEGFLRIVFKLSDKSIEVVTFYITDNIPRVNNHE